MNEVYRSAKLAVVMLWAGVSAAGAGDMEAILDSADGSSAFTVQDVNSNVLMSVASDGPTVFNDTVTLNQPPASGSHAATKQYVDDSVGSHSHSATDITSGTLSTLRYSAYSDLSAESRIGTLSTQVAAGNHGHGSTYVAVAGDTMEGALTLSGDPVSDLQAATKQYVDDRTTTSDSDYLQSQIMTNFTAETLMSASVTAPSAGYVVAWATGYFQSGTDGNWGGASVFLTTDPDATTGTARTRFYRNASVVGTMEVPWAVTGRFAVSAGTQTVYLRGKTEGNGETDVVFYNNLVLMFTP
jgi:hypothetical protein